MLCTSCAQLLWKTFSKGYRRTEKFYISAVKIERPKKQQQEIIPSAFCFFVSFGFFCVLP
jgi:hypothetical protein